MPIREGICENEQCPISGVPQEHYYKSDDSLNQCDCCGGPTRLVMSSFGIVWTGPISQRYRYRDAENYHQKGDGFWATAKRTPDGKPKSVYLDNWQAVRQFAKSEGCADPREISKNMVPNESGKGLQNTVGLPGTEL